MHTKHDSVVSSSNAKKLYAWANEPKQLKLFQYGNHNDIMSVNQKEYFLLLDEFIEGLR